MSNVELGSPAEEAGLKAGDVILSFNGEPLDSAGLLPAAVAATDPGKSVKLEVWRERAKRDFTLKLGEMKDENPVAGNTAESNSVRLGMMVRPLSPEEKQQADLTDGLVVEGVAGAAAVAGIRPGDVVLSANGKAMKSVEQLRAAVEGSKNHIALLEQRGDARIFLPVELG